MIISEKLHEWRLWIEPWYLSYALLGASIAGLTPILLPLAVSVKGNIAEVGIVIATVNLGGLAAPLWGNLADRYRLHRLILASGFLSAALGLAVFPYASSFIEMLVFAFLLGVGSSAAATVANLFIVEIHPKEEWDKRLGWLQTFYGTGQVGGLILAGIMSSFEIKIGLLITAGLTAIALFPGWFWTHKPPQAISTRPVLRHPVRHTEFSSLSPQRFYHYPSIKSVQLILKSMLSPFGLFLISWLISYAGTSAFFSLYPILMRQAYGVNPFISSAGFALAAALGLMLYEPAGNWSGKIGELNMMRIGLIVRIAAFLALFLFTLVQTSIREAGALSGLLFLVLAWSILSVTGTALTANFSKDGEGEGLGLFNASTAIAGVFGAAIGGWLAGQWGNKAVPGFGFVSIIAGLLVTMVIPKPRLQSNSIKNIQRDSIQKEIA